MHFWVCMSTQTNSIPFADRHKPQANRTNLGSHLNCKMVRAGVRVCQQVEEDPTGGKYAGAGSALNGAAHKLESVIQFHVGDVVTSLQRAVMQPGGQEAVLYGTIMGTIGRLPVIGHKNRKVDTVKQQWAPRVQQPHVVVLLL